MKSIYSKLNCTFDISYLLIFILIQSTADNSFAKRNLGRERASANPKVWGGNISFLSTRLGTLFWQSSLLSLWGLQRVPAVQVHYYYLLPVRREGRWRTRLSIGKQSLRGKTRVSKQRMARRKRRLVASFSTPQVIITICS